MRDNFTGLIPDNAVVLNVLRVVEYMDADGDISVQDLSYTSDDSPITPSAAASLIAWANAFNLFPMIAPMIHDYVYEGDEEDE